MIILALDVATRTGWAYGPAGEPPKIGAIKLRGPDDPLTVASNNVGYFLRDRFIFGKPDLVVYEQPLDPRAKATMQDRGGRAQNSASIMLPFLNMGVIEFICHLYGVRVAPSNRQRVLKHFTGQAKFPGRNYDESRRNAKEAVIKQCHVLKLVPPTCRDEDICDAVAIHDWASHTFARFQRRELVLFGASA